MSSSLPPIFREVRLRFEKVMARAKAAKADQALYALPDHLLKDIGIVRHSIDFWTITGPRTQRSHQHRYPESMPLEFVAVEPELTSSSS